MDRRFNTTGVCVPSIHYVVNIENKLSEIKTLVNRGDYFVINRPRQYGKTTTMFMLEPKLKDEYLVMSISFEGIGDEIFSNELKFSQGFLRILSRSIKSENKSISDFIIKMSKEVDSFETLSYALSDIIDESNKPVILLIDEVDKNSNNQLFLSFLGVLRSKFLLRQQGKESSFKSVILAGVYDIKNLKLKIRADEEIRYNSPWNIAVNFDVDMSFTKDEIATMLEEYSKDKKIEMNIKEMASKIHYYSGGYPFLVSRLCQIIDEKLMVANEMFWDEKLLLKAMKILISESNTLFDDLIKNIENNKELKDYIFDLIVNGNEKTFNIHSSNIDLGIMFGYFKNINGKVNISNAIFEQVLYNYFTAMVENKTDMSSYNFKENFIVKDGLDFQKILLRFQQFIKEQYSTIDSKFIEREGRLLFLAFIKPIINGVGFDFKEVQISEEKRLDIIITYLSNKYLVELKIWRGEEYHQKGIKQLYDYMDIQGLDEGYLVIYNFNKSKEYKQQEVVHDNKKIFVIWV
ncbi:AAA family ATPase [Clostridium gasigenes]|uniref:AAA family ATPase n=1 Tax=Clostridium gasigenes TaxID=94869 RepID=A0A7X0SDA7_9CLOT|nr:AAA family ATPase [Clostridium gasigenes]